MSVENIVASTATRQKHKESALKHNKAIAAVKDLGLDEDTHAEILGHIKQSYIKDHAKISEEGINMDAAVDYTPKTRRKKVVPVEEVKEEQKLPVVPLKPVAPAKGGKGKNKASDDDVNA